MFHKTEIQTVILRFFFAFCVLTFVSIQIKPCLAPQNDPVNFSFVKGQYIIGKKMSRNGPKTAIYQYLFFQELANSVSGLRLHLRP